MIKICIHARFTSELIRFSLILVEILLVEIKKRVPSIRTKIRHKPNSNHDETEVYNIDNLILVLIF